MQNSNQTLNVITLGCSKNLVDSEVLLYQLSLSFKNVLHNSDKSADVIIINTCGFILDAKQESIDTILYWAEKKNNGEIKKLLVFGCLTERYKQEIKSEIPEIDALFGVNNFKNILRILNVKGNSNWRQRYVTTSPHYSYLKIGEGCNRKCAFCAIPEIRGKYISKPIEELVDEASLLITKGVKELMVIAQDISYYGFDLYGKQALPDLLQRMIEIKGLDWIRLHYAYPAKFPKETIQLMKDYDKICNYLDIPVQHCNEQILKGMKRGHGKQELFDLLHFFRAEIPDIALRTTLIVGYPGETDKDFQELIDFVQEFRFERLGAFTYSEEEGTSAAMDLKDNLSEEAKNERLNELLEIQQNISLEINQSKIGRTYKVIIDRTEEGNYIGRTQYDSPEVDNEVIIDSKSTLNIGNFYNVKIVDASEFDLYAQIDS